MYPLMNSRYSAGVNRKLTDREITATCRELFAQDPATSGRALRAELKRRFGSPGKTDRVFAAWRALRDESAHRPMHDSPTARGLNVAALEGRLRDAELAREAAEQRALLSAEREIAHQNRWAHELHTLRTEVRRLEGEESRRVALEARVLDLAREIAELRSGAAGR